MVLLDMLVMKRSIASQKLPEGVGFSQSNEIIVAHFEHGIRGEASREDQRFVERLARQYDLPFVTATGNLAEDTSEADAREARYTFLHREAKKYEATIVTAHHADDLVETIAINLTRGTGWRGLAVLSSDVCRPLLHMTKQQIIDYARTHGLVWHEDSTNQSNVYLRNQLRHRTLVLSDDVKYQLLALRDTQVATKLQIENVLAQLLSGEQATSRYFFTMVDHQTADELLRKLCVDVAGFAPTRPARTRMLAAMRTARAGSRHEVMDGFLLTCTKREFRINHHTVTPKRVA